jgi:hypothetical protein
MYIPRLLVLPLLISVCGQPVAAQSSPEKSAVPQSLLTLPQNAQAGIRADQFRLSSHPDGINLSHIIPPPEFREHVLTLGQSDVTCYSIRTYRVTRDDPESDSTRPAGYSTCQPTARFQVKDARDSPVQASFP